MRDMSVDQAIYTIPYLFKVAHWRPCLRRIPGRRFLATTAWLAGWRRRLRSTRSRLPATKLTERATWYSPSDGSPLISQFIGRG